MNDDNKKLLRGIYPALLTPIDEEGRILEQGMKRLLDWEMACGADGFYVGGATGECYSMEEASRKRLLEKSIEYTRGRSKIIAHIGAASFRESLRLAEHAREAGADMVSAAPPPVYSYNSEEIYEYYSRLAETAQLPFLVYANGMFKEADIVPLMEKLTSHPLIIGMKYTRNSYYEMNRLSRLQDGNVNVLNGPDETLLCGLMMGADGGIGSTYNVMPGLYQRLYQAFSEGSFRQAGQIQFQINRIIPVLLKHGQIRVMKEMLRTRGMELGRAERPGLPITSEEMGTVWGELKEAGFEWEE